VTWVDKVVARHGTAKVAKAYLEYLYTPQGQEIAAENFYRPRLPEVADKHKDEFATVKLVTVDDEFGGWHAAQEKFFNDGGVFDQIYQPAN
jgi:sulfate transport system substrate-binding protein